jgi:dolichyl-phosphate beta-glucosyltransferase
VIAFGPMFDLSLIIPSFKAAPILEQSLPPLLEYLQARGIRAEILVVDDGSADDGHTKRAVERSGCIYFANPCNQGKGAAVKRGMLAAKGAVCIFTDADIPFGYASIEQFYNHLRQGAWDMVIGDRSLRDSSYSSRLSPQRALASYLFRLTIGHSVSSSFPDTQCGLKGFSRPVAQALFSLIETQGFAFDVEVLYLAKHAQLRVQRLPVQLQNQGASSVRIARHAPQMLRELARIRMRTLPTVVIGPSDSSLNSSYARVLQSAK